MLYLVCIGLASNVLDAEAADGRMDLGLTPEKRVEFLAEMRQMLASVQSILQGIGSEGRDRIAAAAHLSGTRMARATPDSVRE